MKLQGSNGESITVPKGMEEEVYKAQAEGRLHELVETLRPSAKKGGMLKRKDGSYSRRGLWDNIRAKAAANRRSGKKGKKPTAEMLRQEARIRAKAKDGLKVGYTSPKSMAEAEAMIADGRLKVAAPNNDGAKALKYMVDAVGTVYYPANLLGATWDLTQGDINGAVAGAIPFGGGLKFIKELGNLGKAVGKAEKAKRATTNLGVMHLGSQAKDTYDDIIYPLRDTKTAGGTVFKGYVTKQPMGDAVPFHTSTIGEPETYGKGGYTVKRSSARKGKTHVVIGPDGTKKYFGDSKLGQHPGNPKRKKAFYARHAKNLKGNPYFRAFARATWADGGKLRLSDNMYDLGVMPYGMGGHIQEGPMSHLYAPHTGESVDLMYADGGYTLNPAVYGPKGNINPYTGMINVPMGYGTSAYNQKMNLGGTFKNIGNFGLNILTAPTEQILGNNYFNPKFTNKNWANAAAVSEGVIGAATDVAGTAFLGPAYAMGKNAIKPFTSELGNSQEYQRGADKWANKTSQITSSAGDLISGIASGNPQQIVGGAGQLLGTTGQQLGSKELALTGQIAGTGAQFVNPAAGQQGQSMFQLPEYSMRYGGYTYMAEGGQAGLVPINVEGADFSEGSGPDAKKGELLVLNGKIYKNYVGRPPHPAEGQDPMGNDDAPEGLIVIPKARAKEYLEAGLIKRKQMERSIVSQQQAREMKKSKQMGDGGYYSFGMGEMGMGYGGFAGSPMGNPDRISPETFDDMMTYKKGGWIQKATASIKRRGTEGVCTGSKFGSSSCPPGSRRYNLAKTFRKMAKARKHEYGGFVDPVTGQVPNMYAQGGELLPEKLLEARMEASGKSQAQIENYKSRYYKKEGGPTIHDFPMRRLRYDENTVVRGENLADDEIFFLMNNLAHNDLYETINSPSGFREGYPITRLNPISPESAMQRNMSAAVSNVPSTNYSINPNLPGNPYNAMMGRIGSPRLTDYTTAMNQASSNQFNAGPVGDTTSYNPYIRRMDNSAGMSLSGANRNPYSMGALRGTPEGTMGQRYMAGVDESMRSSFPDLYSNKSYNLLGSTQSTSSPTEGDRYANALEDIAGVIPTAYNLVRGFEKPDLLRGTDYMTPGMQFRATRFDKTPYDQAASRAQYALRQMGSGPGYRAALGNIAAQAGQARSQGYMDWMNKEALRRQGVDEANLGIGARNKAMQFQVDMLNQQAKANKARYFETAAEQFAQTFGRDPMYFRAMAGQKPRQRFTGWRGTPQTSGGSGTSVNWDELSGK